MKLMIGQPETPVRWNGVGLDGRAAAREGSYLGIIKLLFGHRLVQY